MYSETLLLNTLVEIYGEDALGYAQLILRTRDRIHVFPQLDKATVTAVLDGPFVESVTIESHTLPGRINLFFVPEDERRSIEEYLWWSVSGMGNEVMYSPEDRWAPEVEYALREALAHMGV